MRAIPEPIRRLALGVICGLIVGFGVGGVLGLAAGLLAGWGFGALVVDIAILVVVWPMNAEKTRTHARQEAPGRQTARLIAVVGSVASLGAVAAVLLESSTLGRPESFVLAGIALGSVVASWALIQLDYMLRVARVYYAEPVGGMSFNQDEDPMYTDFVYFAVGLGMTYQVADTNLQSNELRRIVIAQTMLAYLFGAVILASVINLVSNL
ncbi:DUF1345 domain-containing protein [Microbacterium rhizomatis]|uniref:DUF1345 domain-containing protein n=1 Tax=Microbacterium rhizomatis TaxID=1631477 RepID=A0A5J5J437_9MICO|nr:DUF1345 domain-containing protein [Microbacterium rhizomatis]KAA9110219.1 DUF1345 domain-containing protein [Microbacterium rhizomatis]